MTEIPQSIAILVGVLRIFCGWSPHYLIIGGQPGKGSTR